MPEQHTHFGFQKIPISEKARRVAGVFDSVASRYDLMNDLMSLGTHRVMKRIAIEATGARPGQCVMDLAGGTGDLTAKLSRLVGDTGKVVLCDINQSMLERGRERLTDQGIVGNVDYVIGDAEHLPFPEDTFNSITMAFGLRNVTDKSAALGSILRVLKPGGRVVVLEFSRPQNPGIRSAYDAFSKFWPKAGELLVGDKESYQYLVESIRVHPDQVELQTMMEDAGYEDCRFHNLLNGIVAIHTGSKP